jgi:F420-non-reducing hydrogenase iron-sulfur subunit
MKPRIVIYCCTNSTLEPEEQVEAISAERDVVLKMVRLPCSGRTDVLHILKAIEDGADMAMIVGCADGHCRFLEGNVRAEKRVNYVNRLLAEAGLGSDRVRMFRMDASNGSQFAAALREMAGKAGELGPWLSPKDNER